MVRLKQSVLLSSLIACVLLPLGSCANTPWAKQLENSLAADPQLEANNQAPEATSPEATPSATTAQLPQNFPAEIPRYPNAELVSVTGANQETVAVGASQTVQTRWQTADSVEQVQQFYREQFQSTGWQLASSAGSSATQPIEAARDGLQVTVSPSSADGKTEFDLNYQFGGQISGQAGQNGESTANSPSPEASPNASNAIPQPGDPNFIGPVLPSQVAQADSGSNDLANNSASSSSFSDLSQAPTELQPYVSDLAKLGALPDAKGGSSSEFKPNAEISRRDYARWLVTANNLIYANQPARKIRLAAATDKPAFQDVPASDPDFGVIQGLANAGLISSPLSGDATSVTFRPDAPLIREDLILWKVPVDLRQALPNASIDAIQQSWGFQDTAKIDPKAMRAVLADFQNGDLSNIRRAFGYTTLFQPKKSVSRAEAAAVLWGFGSQGNNLTAKDALQLKQSTATPQ